MKPSVIGVDGGGTHSRGVLISLSGDVLALESAGPSNYLNVGLKAATHALETLISRLKAVARDREAEIVAAGFGLSGLDRAKDAEAFTRVLEAVGATQWPLVLVNDAFLALRAGTLDGVGLVAVSGTGSNTVGVDAKGRRERVGGLSYECGDFGGADDIGIAGLRAAFRGEDGRGPKTALSDRLRRELGISRLDEVLDRMTPDAPQPFAAGGLAPAVFELARGGDAVAAGILQQAGHDLGVAARIVAERLFAAGDSFALVLGGRVLAEGQSDVMREALVAEVRSAFPHVKPHKLDADPVLGAALLAIDKLKTSGSSAAPARWPDAEIIAAAKRGLATLRPT